MEPNSVIDVTQRGLSHRLLALTVENGMERATLQISPLQTLAALRAKIRALFPSLPTDFDLFCREQVLEGKDDLSLSVCGMGNGEVVSVKLKIPLRVGLRGRIRLARSIGGNEDNSEESDP
jgi:hypothetical protein